MTTLEYKSNLFQKLEKVSDITLLQAVSELVDLNSESSQSHWDTLSNEDKVAIQEGINQLDNGQYVKDENVRENLKSKFSFLK
ncbi:MAG TPA: hypothetical protein DDX39_05760 [Bacteroidales bacterium]|nr:MAG: hypothetical protein A2W98_07030 [Bacteroidetes bacterium GWF2_33_38]OFY68591.1 MAG: hypothetical protein A2265_02690 [Bacteroidetes bacterium RIFOXYA12_FULL_33_9]OFY91972.1 MAG: hypothetical protein A2236_13600 [Bacteroidetes bacterium RIFOXYA2_FULL_33_7]HBF88130.1 hypothetical protein [Bacteroidales bacterium]